MDGLLNDVGNLCWLLSRNSSAPDQVLPNLRQAIQSYQLALKKLDTHTQAQSYPMLHNNLGAAYADLARYEQPVENLQKSAQSYREALRYRDASSDPARYASTQNNLGTTYWNLAQHHQPKESLKRAIAAYQEALKYPNSQPPLSYAMIQNNLGTALWSLAQIEQPEIYLPKAIAAYRPVASAAHPGCSPGGLLPPHKTTWARPSGIWPCVWAIAPKSSSKSSRQPSSPTKLPYRAWQS
ncbi:tetratricopeptide repeat protein [Leptolyngbya sp. O-77]|uniref:tetratricopeptide repeat protein n=1 Tax=Leptolyngbya sp. O-77 TaxID=1080068 RepID=UPI00074D37FF|nr:tetratricopeptide repeat protein [Leptolyngbya sp. O-77]BAU40378.1 hypothetical protein O77CONTIG1_00175 [Leptolyngbya sp. O-77]